MLRYEYDLDYVKDALKPLISEKAFTTCKNKILMRNAGAWLIAIGISMSFPLICFMALLCADVSYVLLITLSVIVAGVCLFVCGTYNNEAAFSELVSKGLDSVAKNKIRVSIFDEINRIIIEKNNFAQKYFEYGAYVVLVALVSMYVFLVTPISVISDVLIKYDFFQAAIIAYVGFVAKMFLEMFNLILNHKSVAILYLISAVSVELKRK